jgi:HTH-type transcriptional regulator/antitoxin HigA
MAATQVQSTGAGAGDNAWVRYTPTEVLAPGETIRETLDALDMSQAQLAQRTGMSTKHVNQILQGQAALTHDTAILLERTTGVSARFWNSLEAQYRDHLAREHERQSLSSHHTWLKQMPLAALRKIHAITATARDPGAQLQQVLQFFGVSSIDAWQQVWAEPAAAFLQSAAFDADAGAVAAWLRIGELEAAKINCDPFERVRLKELLPTLRSLTVHEPQRFWPALQKLCATVGIAVVVVPEVTGARASGATRWISPNKAIVQLSNRGKRNDKFWFAFFHEIGHVLLHGKREVFVENKIGYDGGRLRQESEANDFAGSLLIPSEFEAALDRVRTAHDVRKLAERLEIAPAIVAGRIQRDRDDYRFGLNQGLFVKFEIVRGSEAQESD